MIPTQTPWKQTNENFSEDVNDYGADEWIMTWPLTTKTHTTAFLTAKQRHQSICDAVDKIFNLMEKERAPIDEPVHAANEGSVVDQQAVV